MSTSGLDEDTLHQSVRKAYRKVAQARSQGCGCGVPTSCCGTAAEPDSMFSLRLGYTAEELALLPEGADMGLNLPLTG